MENVFNFDYKWSRPTTIPFPHVWHEFEVKTSTGKCFKGRVEDLTPDRHEEVWELFKQHYFREEPIAKSLRLAEDEAALTSLEHDYKAVMKQNTSLIVVLDEPGAYPKLMGVYLRSVISKDEPTKPPPQVIRSPIDKYNYIFLNLQKNTDVFGTFKCDKYYDEYGIFVVPEFRNLGISEHLFHASAEYALAFEIGGEFAVMVNPYLRPVSKKFGFHLFQEVVLKDLKDSNGNTLITDSDIGIRSIFVGGCKFC